MVKKTTVGIIICDNQKLLGCKPYNSKYIDIPKGKMEKGETYEDTLFREVQEETGLFLRPYINSIRFVGKFNRVEKSDVVLYLLRIKKFPRNFLKQLHCSSFFSKKDFLTGRNIQIPEIIGYTFVYFDEVKEKLLPSISYIIYTICKKL